MSTGAVADQNTKQVGQAYFNQIFGHIHQNPSRYSTSLTNIACAHPVRIKAVVEGEREQRVFAGNWKLIQAGPYLGYVKKTFLSQQRPPCFQDRYPRFFEQLELSISEMHFWGRLYDHFLIERSEL